MSKLKGFLKSVPSIGEKVADIVSAGVSAVTTTSTPSKKSVVSSRDAKLHYLFGRVKREGGEQAHTDLKTEVDHRMFVDKLFAEAFPKHFGPDADLVELTVQPSDYPCLR